jgi:catechol 2,3-dioxygenase-like lactoylglutathione lyase family enzyme
MAVGPVAQIHISVTDLDRSLDFYTRILGIPLLFRVPGRPMAFLASGDVRLYLGVPERPEFTSRVLLYFRVDDIDAEYERLVATGVPFQGPPRVVHQDQASRLWMASFSDPDGHPLVLMQERPLESR